MTLMHHSQILAPKADKAVARCRASEEFEAR